MFLPHLRATNSRPVILSHFNYQGAEDCQEQPVSTLDPLQSPAQMTAVSSSNEISVLCGVTLIPCALQHPAEDKEVRELSNDVQDIVNTCLDIDDGDGDLYVSPDMPTLTANEGEKAAPLPDSDLSLATALPRPQLYLLLLGSLTALSCSARARLPDCNSHLLQAASVRRAP